MTSALLLTSSWSSAAISLIDSRVSVKLGCTVRAEAQQGSIEGGIALTGQERQGSARSEAGTCSLSLRGEETHVAYTLHSHNTPLLLTP